MRGPAASTGGRVDDALVSHLDLYPTICDVAGIDRPDWLEGASLLPLVHGEVDEIRDEVFAEVTYHAAYEPQRAVRTTRYKYMRRFDDEHPGRVLANVDDGLTKDVAARARAGPTSTRRPRRSTTSGSTRPRARTASTIPRSAEVLADLRRRLPRLDGPDRGSAARRARAPGPGTVYNTVDQRSAEEPTVSASDTAS